MFMRFWTIFSLGAPEWSVSIYISEIDLLWESVDWARNKGLLSAFKGIKLVKLLRESARALAEVTLPCTSFLTPLNTVNTLFNDFAEKDKFRGGRCALWFPSTSLFLIPRYPDSRYISRGFIYSGLAEVPVKLLSFITTNANKPKSPWPLSARTFVPIIRPPAN